MSDSDTSQTGNIIHGVGKTTDQIQVDRAHKTAPLPEGLEEVNDRELSFGAAPGHNDGKGDSIIHGHDENKGLGALPGDDELKKDLGKGTADIADRDGNPAMKKSSGSNK